MSVDRERDRLLDFDEALPERDFDRERDRCELRLRDFECDRLRLVEENKTINQH